MVLTNTLGGTSFWLRLNDAHGQVAKLNVVVAKLARQAADAHTKSTSRQFVFTGAIGPTGELFEPLGASTYITAFTTSRKKASALAKAGVNVS